ncbi:carotenoid 1,2-hydratase [Aquabacterium sp. J223]|uniref:lipocalin-like domain-containing protein n=1 Tax=Aquabacterium sp. J223 TaxID=2898431 RepID=UPI00289CB400|nr:carotenoid 1,2-hydratase [Aquabacterium sp. J223]
MDRRHGLAALAALGLPTVAGAADPPALGVGPRALRFPADFGAHPDTRTEWWYVTGWLVLEGEAPAEVGPAFGFQVTFFRSRTDVPADTPSRFAARQLVFAHAALTDLAAGRLRHDQRLARAGFGVAEAATGDTALVLRDWSLRRDGPVGDGGYRSRVVSTAQGFAFDLAFSPTQPLLLQGLAGLSRKGPDPREASHYYSRPQLAVRGRLQREARAPAVPVRGRAWLDHEWSETLLHPEAVGWDWIGMNLHDGAALTAFRLRRRDGSTVWAGGSFRPVGAAAPQVFDGADAVGFEPLRWWTSPATGARYPVGWRVRTPAGAFVVRALLGAQELDSRGSTGSVYWEGISELLTDDAGGRGGWGWGIWR